MGKGRQSSGKNGESIGVYLFFFQLILHHAIIKNIKSAQKFSICYGSSLFNEMFCKTLNTVLNLSAVSTSSNTNMWVTIASITQT